MKKCHHQVNLSLAILGTLICSTVFAKPINSADSIELHITGNVIASACTIDNNGAYNIDLGQNIRSSRLNSNQPYSDWKAFDVTLSNCPKGTSSATVTFSGTPDSVKTDMYANNTGTSYADNVAVELQRVTGGVNAGNGKSLTVDVDNQRKVTFDLQARVYGRGRVTSGNIAAAVLMNLTYN